MKPELQYFTKLQMLRDTLAVHRNTPTAIGDVEALLSDLDVRREFFAELDRPDWIIPLYKAGYFGKQPKAQKEQDAGQYLNWPESKYLVRMAPHAPAEVAAIFAEIENENMSIIGDMIDAALAMPPEQAAILVPNICQPPWNKRLGFFAEKAGELCIYLAEGNQVDTAMSLADALFMPRVEDGKEDPNRNDVYWYTETLNKVIPVLTLLRPSVFLFMLCNWLKVAIHNRKQIHADSGSDYSHIWRPAIEEHNQNRDYEFAGVMVGLVRAGFEQAIRQEQIKLAEALEIVRQHDSLVFRRLEIYLINSFYEQNPNLARRVMMDHSLFDDHEYKHEYAMLMGDRLDLLIPEEREKWFGWIDAGPDVSKFNESLSRVLDREVTNEEKRARLKHWQFEKLHWVRTYLEGERRTFYETMLAEHGEPELADLNMRVGSVQVGSESPMTYDDLVTMTFEDAVEKVSAWKTTEQHFMGPNIEGLAATFGQYVATDPQAFSSKAILLVGKSAIYVREFISQMSKAVAVERGIDIQSVIELCNWVVEQPVEERTTPEQDVNDSLVDENWLWTREEISRLLENTCKAKRENVPIYPIQELRKPMWQLLEALCHDRAKSNIVDDASEEDPRMRDYLELGINSPRGRAVEAALEYARWVVNHIKQTEEKREIVPGGFESLPEVRDMLEWQIAPGNRSFEALSIIGSSIGLIYWIDKNWLRKNTDRLFNLGGIEESPPKVKGWAAWNAFLVWVRPHNEFYTLLKKQFAFAVKQVGQANITEPIFKNPLNYLGQHLILLFGRGHLDVGDDDDLLLRFLANSNSNLRCHVIGFVGQSLESNEQIPKQVIDRFMTLWEVYWGEMGRIDAEEKPDSELFGTWFSSGQFPEDWALKQLEQFVEVARLPEPAHKVVEELAKLAHTDPKRAVHILDRMIHSNRENWRIQRWQESARQILQTAMESGNHETCKTAVILINYLGRRGFNDFGQLLG